jgi:hypothetical protein
MMVATIFFVIHAFAVLNFANHNVPLVGPESDSGAMAWIMWVFVDFPTGYLALLLASDMPSPELGVACIIVVGGLQWAFVGWLLQAGYTTLKTRDRIRSTAPQRQTDP